MIILFYPFLPPECATASSAAVNTLLSVPEPLPPTPTTNDDNEFDVLVNPELFSYPPLPSVDSTPQETQGEEMGDGLIPIEEVMAGQRQRHYLSSPPSYRPRCCLIQSRRSLWGQ